MDFAQLAQLIKPQQLGNQVVPGMGVQHGQQRAMMENFLAKASEQAEMEAKMKAMQAEEFALGAPMRRSEMDLKTLTNQQKFDMLKKYGMDDEMAKRYKADVEAAWPTISALKDATTEEEIVAALEGGPTRIGDVDLRNMPPDKAKRFAEKLFAGRTSKDPKHIQDMEKETLKQTESTKRKGMEVAGREKLAAARADLQKNIAAAKAAAAAGKPPTESQMKAKILQDLLDSGKMTEEMIVQMWHDQKVQARPADVARAETAQGMGMPGVAVPETPKIPFNEPKAPTQAATKPTDKSIPLPKERSKLVKGQLYDVPGEKNKFKWDGNNLIEQ